MSHQILNKKLAKSNSGAEIIIFVSIESDYQHIKEIQIFLANVCLFHSSSILSVLTILKVVDHSEGLIQFGVILGQMILNNSSMILVNINSGFKQNKEPKHGANNG